MPGAMVPVGLENKVDAINAADFKTARSLMPTIIQKAVIEGVPMSLVYQASPNIIGYIEHELIILSAMVNVDQRLNIQRHQLPVIAQELYETFKTESMEDISVCFRRGVMGTYGEIYRLDGAVIAGWMRAYLEEKYQVIESNLMSEKENFYQVKRDKPDVPVKINPERNLLALLKTVIGDVKPADETNRSMNNYQRWKLFQNDLRKAEKAFYKGNPPAETNRYDDDEGHYVYAASLEDAEEIYTLATTKQE